MTNFLYLGTPLVCLPTSFMIDPALTDAVDVEYDKTALHSPTTGPNRYTIHVPTETTRLSLGQKSTRWNTDIGITGYTDSHIHFETKENDKTIVSLGGPATTTDIPGHDKDVVSKTSRGYSMVTEKNAWHEAMLQHHLLSQTEDMSLRTAGPLKRAVVQADHGKIDLNGGKQVNVSGGGVSIAAGELAVEKKGYDEPWTGIRPHSSAAGGTQIAMAVLAALSAVGDVIINKTRNKFEEGNFAGIPEKWLDKTKRPVNTAMALLAMNKVRALISAEPSPPQTVKLNAAAKIGAMAGGDISIFGAMGASLGSALWTSITSGMSASLKGTVFAGVGAAFASMKGYRKVEMGSDWGKVFVGAAKEIHLQGEESFTAGADNVAHVASPSAEGHALFGGGDKVWLGTAKGFGLLLDKEGLALGAASGADEMDTATIKPDPALRLTKTELELKTKYTSMKLAGSTCAIATKDKKIRFEATGGQVTINGAKILLK